MLKLEIKYYKEGGELVIIYKNNLLREYPELLTDLFKENKELSGITRIRKESDNLVHIFVKASVSVEEDYSDEGILKAGIEKELLNEIGKILNMFTLNALSKKLRETEFLPLSGYPLEKLREDVEEMVKNKRSACVISDYSRYLENNKLGTTTKSFRYNQVMLKYSSDQYCNFVIDVQTKSLEELRATYSGQLVETDWL